VNPRTKRRIILSSAVVGGLAAAVAGGLMARSWYRGAQLAEKREEGLALFIKGEFGAALEPLSFAARDNRDTEVVLALAECRMRVPESNGRHFATAAAYFRAVQARDERNVRAMRGLLEAYIGLGRLPEIPPLVKRVLAEAPRDVRAREIELEVLNLTGKFSEAAAKARELQELEPANGRWRAAELVSLERAGADAVGRLARVREWQQGSDAVSADPVMRLLESDLLREIGRADEARSILRGLAEAGVADRRQLETLIGAIESSGFEVSDRDALVGTAIAKSRAALAKAGDASEIEGERLLRAGRLEEIATRFGDAPPSDPAVFRLRFAALYLAGKVDEAAAFARAHAAPEGRRDAFTSAALAVGSDEPARVRIEAIAGPHRACPKDPVAAILLADVMLESGEFDEAQSILVRAFEESGDAFQPAGIRAVRASVTLGRVRDAYRIAEELLFRYGPSGDAAVALLAVEAWAAVLESSFQPTTRGGVYGTDSPAALRRFWAALSGPDAAYGPASLAPAVADVFLARGDRETAKDILEHAIAQSGDGASGDLRGLGSGKISRALKTASTLDPALQGAMLGRLEGADADAELAAVVAERLLAQGEKDAALRAIDRALDKANPSEKRILERLRRPIAQPEGVAEWLANELRTAPGLDTAIFVLSRPEPWAAKDDTLLVTALGQMKEALGADSLRVLVAEAAVHMAFHAADRSRIAASIAALDAAALRSPESASVLTTLAALFERQTPPQFERSSKLLARAVEAEPGSASIYPQLVNALQQVGDFEGAEEALEAYIRIVGDDLQSKRSVADFKVRQGQLAEAAQIREQLVGRSKEVVDAVALARIRQRLGDMASAERILTDVRAAFQAATERPDGADYGRELLIEREIALLYARDGRLADARLSLDRSEGRLGGTRFDEVRANVELAYGDLAIALGLAQELVRKEASANHELLLARALLRTGDQVKAREALTRSLIADPDNTDATAVAAALLVGDPSGRALLERSLAAASVRRPDLAAAIALLDGVTTPDGRIAVTEAALGRALALTAEFSASPLAWRVAAQLHILADRKDDAFRIAQRALSRLPSDAAIGKLATETAIAAGRIDDAASSALAWRKMASSEPFEVDVARATIELVQRRPEQGFDLLRPIAREIITRSTDGAALRTLVACAVLSGRFAEIRGDLALLPASRRGEGVSAWLEAAQVLPVDQAMTAIDAIAGLAEGDAVATAACIAAWTGLCRAGESGACGKAEAALASFESDLVPKAILAADLTAARGDHDGALAQYRAQFEPVLARFAQDARADLAALASRAAGGDAAFIEAIRRTPVAIVALNNAADALLTPRQGDASAARARSAEAVHLATIALAAIPGAPEAIDTLVRALVADGRHPEALAAANTNPDPILSAIEIAEVEVARRSTAEARRALARADARIQASFAPTRTLAERMQRLQAAISEAVAEGTAHAHERNER
jgi:tetratricopeptide (TPR) repeat protein